MIHRAVAVAHKSRIAFEERELPGNKGQVLQLRFLAERVRVRFIETFHHQIAVDGQLSEGPGWFKLSALQSQSRRRFRFVSNESLIERKRFAVEKIG